MLIIHEGKQMFTLIMALFIGFGGSGGVDDTYHCLFDGDMNFVAHTPSDYVVVKIFSCDDPERHELIWTSNHLQSGDSYCHLAYGNYRAAELNDPFKVTFTHHIGQLISITSVCDLDWTDDFFPIRGRSYDLYCTNDY